MDLSTRASNSLKNAGIKTVGEITEYSEIDLMEFEEFGKTSLVEIKKKLEELNKEINEGKNVIQEKNEKIEQLKVEIDELNNIVKV